MITEEEERAFLKNEEKLWDLAALTVAGAIYNFGVPSNAIASYSYDIADALMAERRKRLLGDKSEETKK